MVAPGWGLGLDGPAVVVSEGVSALVVGCDLMKPGVKVEQCHAVHFLPLEHDEEGVVTVPLEGVSAPGCEHLPVPVWNC